MSHIRLSTLATTSLAILLFGTSCGAKSPQQEEPTEVLIFGDVEKSGIFQVPNPMSAAEFVNHARGLSGGTANVRVVRGGYGDAKVAWGEYISKGQACDFQIAHGDMLVVHSLKRLSGEANASKSIEVTVINSETRPLIVTLSPGQGRVADVLKKVEMSDHEFRIVRTNPRAAPVNANANTILEHGDLLMVGNPPVVRAAPLARVTQASGQQTAMVPAHGADSAGPLLIPVSEQTVTHGDGAPNDDAASMDDSEPIPVEANYGALSVPGPEMRPAPGQGISSPRPPAGFVPTPNNGGEIRDPLKTDPWLLGAPPNAPSSDSGAAQTLQQGADGIPAFDGNQSAYNGGGSNYPGGYMYMVV